MNNNDFKEKMVDFLKNNPTVNEFEKFILKLNVKREKIKNFIRKLFVKNKLSFLIQEQKFVFD